MSQEKWEQERKQLRQEMIKEAETLSKKQRFALFSSPIPLGLGDDSGSFKKIPKRGENGKPITEPSNIKVSAPRTGRIKSSYFGPLSFTTVGDPYVDPDKVFAYYEKQQKKLCNKEVAFRPTSGYKELSGSSYPHLQEYNHKKTESRKQSDGRVYSAPKNVTTNPKCRLLDKSLPHMMDEYFRCEELEKKARQESKKKEKEQAFKTTVYGLATFEKDKIIYGDTKMPQTTPRKSPTERYSKHEAPFRPANPIKHGYQGDFNKIVYKSDPLREAKRRFSVKKEKESFKPADLGKQTRPTPSISCFRQNIIKEAKVC